MAKNSALYLDTKRILRSFSTSDLKNSEELQNLRGLLDSMDIMAATGRGGVRRNYDAEQMTADEMTLAGYELTSSDSSTKEYC